MVGPGQWDLHTTSIFFSFFFFSFFSLFKPLCASLGGGFGLGGSIWDVQLPEVQLWVGWRVSRLGTGTAVGAPWAAAAAAEHQEPSAPPDPHQLLAPLCSRRDFTGSKLVFSQWYHVNTSCTSSPEPSPCSLSQKKLAHRSCSCPNLSPSPKAGVDLRDVALWGQQVFSPW